MRVTKVTDTRKKEDFAHFIRDLVAVHFSDAVCIQLVLDNLDTHFKESLQFFSFVAVQPGALWCWRGSTLRV
jgi:hypothetical protein